MSQPTAPPAPRSGYVGLVVGLFLTAAAVWTFAHTMVISGGALWIYLSCDGDAAAAVAPLR